MASSARASSRSTSAGSLGALASAARAPSLLEIEVRLKIKNTFIHEVDADEEQDNYNTLRPSKSSPAILASPKHAPLCAGVSNHHVIGAHAATTLPALPTAPRMCQSEAPPFSSCAEGPAQEERWPTKPPGIFINEGAGGWRQKRPGVPQALHDKLQQRARAGVGASTEIPSYHQSLAHSTPQARSISEGEASSVSTSAYAPQSRTQRRRIQRICARNKLARQNIVGQDVSVGTS